MITHDFVHGADYEALADAGRHLPRPAAAKARVVKRGEGERQKEEQVGDFRQAMALADRAKPKRAVARQRYKGLGEMNPEQLWETTMDPTVRRLLRVQIDDAIEADRAAPYEFIASSTRSRWWSPASSRSIFCSRSGCFLADKGRSLRDREPVCPYRSEEGNSPALNAVAQVYEFREFFEWRGLGSIDHSGVRLRSAYTRFDAERKFALPNVKIADPNPVNAAKC